MVYYCCWIRCQLGCDWGEGNRRRRGGHELIWDFCPWFHCLVANLIFFVTGSAADDYSSWSSLSSSSSGDAVVGRAGFYDFRRRPRSYRSDRDSSKPVAMANIVGAGPVGAGVSSRSSSSSSSSTADKSDALFATENSTVVTAQIGSTANLPCVVKNLGNGVVSENEKFPPLFIIPNLLAAVISLTIKLTKCWSHLRLPKLTSYEHGAFLLYEAIASFGVFWNFKIWLPSRVLL